MSDFRPSIPWFGLFVASYGFLTGSGMFALAPWLFAKGLWFGGFLAVVGGGALALVFGREICRLLRLVRTRDLVGRQRQEAYEAFERRLAGLPDSEKGPALADEIEAILAGKR